MIIKYKDKEKIFSVWGWALVRCGIYFFLSLLLLCFGMSVVPEAAPIFIPLCVTVFLLSIKQKYTVDRHYKGLIDAWWEKRDNRC